MKKVQINRILKGIKLAVDVINLEGDKLFADTPKQVNEIEKVIAKLTKAANANHLVNVGFTTTMADNSVMKLNLQNEEINKTIYSRNESDILSAIDVTKIND